MALWVSKARLLCAAGKKGSAAEGKVVDAQGKPLVNVKVIATQDQPLKGYERIETKTKPDGTFVLKGLYPSAAYKLSFDGGQCDDEKTEMPSAPAGETTMLRGNVVLKFSLFTKGSDGVITDPRTGLEWVPAPNKGINWDQAKQYVEGLSLAGVGWRLPTRMELRELYNTGKTECGCGEILGGGSWAWSSELSGPEIAWYFVFTTGLEDIRSRNSPFSANYDHDGRVLAVRSKK